MASSFALICNWQFYYLYKIQGHHISLILTDARFEPILSRLMTEQVAHLIVFDHSQNHTLKIEKIGQRLNVYDYLQWYWQKRKLSRHQFLWSLIHPLLPSQNLLIAGINDSQPLAVLTNKLLSSGINFSFFSYPLGLGHILRQRLKAMHPEISNPLLIIVDRFMRITLFFYKGTRIAFVRECLPSSQQSLEQYVKSAVLDTLRYLEKNEPSYKINPIFFIEGTFPSLKEYFSDALFFYERELETLVQLSSENHGEYFFDLILLSPKKPRYQLRLGHHKGAILSCLTQYLVPLMRICTALVLALALYLTYSTLALVKKNQQLSQEAHSLKDHLQQLNTKLNALPLSSQQLPYLQKLLACSQKQNTELWQFLDLLAHVLGDHYTLRALSITLKKSRLLIESIDPHASFDSFLDMWQQTFADIRFVAPPDSSCPFLTLESHSPFQYEP